MPRRASRGGILGNTQEQDPPELLAQELEPEPRRVQRLAHVARHEQHVPQVIHVRQALDPVQVLPVVDVNIADAEDARRRQARVPGEPLGRFGGRRRLGE